MFFTSHIGLDSILSCDKGLNVNFFDSIIFIFLQLSLLPSPVTSSCRCFTSSCCLEIVETTNTPHLPPSRSLIPQNNTMSRTTADLLSQNFDDSEDEEDFNPQQADVSDAEEGDGGDSDHDEDAGAQIQNEAAKRRVIEDEPSDDDAPAKARRRSADRQHGADASEDEQPEAEADVGVEDNDDDEEEDEEDDEEEITVHI